MMNLLFDKRIVGAISIPIFADNTWHGVLAINDALVNDTFGMRIIDFIRFSEDWHERLRMNQSNPPASSEFDSYLDLLQSDQWVIQDLTEDRYHQIEGPVFFEGGEFSCRTWEFANASS